VEMQIHTVVLLLRRG